MASDLFRKEVFEARVARLHGHLVITPNISSWVITGAVALFAALAIFWATSASYARTERVIGVVASARPLTKILAVRPGTVTRLLVREGDVVAAGTKLLVVKTELQNEGGVTTATAGLAAIDAQAELTGQRLTLEAQRVATEKARLNAVIAGARRQRESLLGQMELQDALAQSTKASFDQLKQVVADGFVTRTEFERRRQQWLQAEQGRRALTQQAESAAASIAAAEAELARLPIDSAVNVAQLRTSAEQLAQGRAQQSAEQGYTIVAPVAGRVTTVQTATGRFVDGRVPLMTIVPLDTKMEVDLFAPSRSIGFIVPGQSVRLLYDAFPYQRFGSFGGRITGIGRAIIAPTEIDAAVKLEEPVYRIKVLPDQQAVVAHGVPARLQPGMTLSANIVLERRSFIDWLLAPLRAVQSRT
jgi:membrane fusion protein